MLWIPRKGNVRVQHNTGTVGASPPGTSLTTDGGSQSTKGAYATLIANTSFDAYWVTIVAGEYGSSGTASRGCLDIAVGAATQEVLIPNLLMGQCGIMGTYGSFQGHKRWDFPLYIPAGTAISARVAGQRTGVAMRVQIWLFGGNGLPPWRTGSKVTTYGIGTVPVGTSITPGTSGAAGSAAQITASTTEDHFALVPSFQIGDDGTTTNSAQCVEMLVGAATEEVVSMPYWFGVDSEERMCGPINSFPCFVNVPSGTRLSMRASNSASSNDAGYDGAIHAVS